MENGTIGEFKKYQNNKGIKPSLLYREFENKVHLGIVYKVVLKTLIAMPKKRTKWKDAGKR
jgi:hypothetical protein